MADCSRSLNPQRMGVNSLRRRGRQARPMGAAATDRGFASAANRRALAAADIFDGLCPRSPAELSKKFKGRSLRGDSAAGHRRKRGSASASKAS